MPALLLRHKIADYAAWRPVFDGHGVMRGAGGSRGGRVFRSPADPNGGAPVRCYLVTGLLAMLYLVLQSAAILTALRLWS